jgi:FAD/FMN-containing dehydrogenase
MARPQADLPALRLHRELIAAVGDERCTTHPTTSPTTAATAVAAAGPCGRRWIVFPGSLAEVQAVVRACAAHGVAIVPSGGRTGLAGAATATNGEVVLSLEKMKAILAVDPAARTLRCEPGVTLQSVHEAAAAHGLLYPVDYASKGSAQIGGSLATNAGGVKVLRYGLTRDWVLGLKAVVASGACLELGGALVKNNTGYDLRQLFIGSEGTLGVIVEVTLRLCRPPADTRVALCAAADDAAVLALFARLRASDLQLSAFECLDHGCLGHVLHHRGGSSPFAEASPRYVLVEIEVPVAGGRPSSRPRPCSPSSSATRPRPVRSTTRGSPAHRRRPADCGRCARTSASRCTATRRTRWTSPCRSRGSASSSRPGAPPSPRACRRSRRCASATSATATCT